MLRLHDVLISITSLYLGWKLRAKFRYMEASLLLSIPAVLTNVKGTLDVYCALLLGTEARLRRALQWEPVRVPAREVLQQAPVACCAEIASVDNVVPQ